MKSLVVFALMVSTAHAALFTNPSLDAASRTLTVRPPAGYHFNLEAPPPQLTVGEAAVKVTKLTATEAVLTLPEGAKTVAARWFVCDDSKSVCMAVREWLVVDGATVTAKPALGAAGHAAVDAPSGAPAAAGSVAHGFVVDRPDEALAQAKKERRPLMIDFFGIWCPPCNQLDEMVFCRPEFARASEAFVKVKLDADRDASWSLKERYKIGGYPTIVFANADGEEIDRLVGARSLKEFLARIEDALAHQNQPRAALEKAAAAGDAAAKKRLGKMLIERGEFADAEKALAGSNETLLLKRAHVGAAKDAIKQAATDGKAAARAAYLAALRSALEGEAGPDVLDWTNALADLLDEDGDAAGTKATYERMAAAAQALEAKPELLEAEGLTRCDLLQYKAGALEALKDEAGATAAYAAAATEYEREIKDAGLLLGTSRGSNLERAFCLGKGGQPDAALALYKQLEATYPNEFTFLFAHAGLLQTLKRNDEAEPLARQALAASYGDNRLRAAERLAKIQKERGQADDARTVVNAAIAEAKAPADPFNRTHRYIKALKTLLKSL